MIYNLEFVAGTEKNLFELPEDTVRNVPRRCLVDESRKSINGMRVWNLPEALLKEREANEKAESRKVTSCSYMPCCIPRQYTLIHTA